MATGRGTSSVHYKFTNAPDYSTITFDDHYISLSELKRRIFANLGTSTPDCDLRVTNAQTQEGLLRLSTSLFFFFCNVFVT